MDGPTLVSGDYDLFGLFHRLEAMVTQTGARAIVLDSATALFSPRPPYETLRNHFFQLISTFRRLGLTAVIIAEAPSDYGQLTTMGVEDYVCDLTLIVRNVIDGGRRRRSIEVNKYRRSAHFKGEYPCTITPRGLAIFPLEAQERQDGDSVERYSSGVEGLDEMTRGGWLRNSIIIVRGPTGSGKTMLAGLYARAGAARGERVVYYGFEETRPILLRNYREIGMHMDAHVKDGRLKVICRYPEATSLEDLLVDLRLGLEDLKPSLIVLDSISSIEHASSEPGIPVLHHRGGVHSPRVRPQRADHSDHRHVADERSYGAVPVDDRRCHPDARLHDRWLRSGSSDARHQDARFGSRAAPLQAG